MTPDAGAFRGSIHTCTLPPRAQCGAFVPSADASRHAVNIARIMNALSELRKAGASVRDGQRVDALTSALDPSMQPCHPAADCAGAPAAPADADANRPGKHLRKRPSPGRRQRRAWRSKADDAGPGDDVWQSWT